MVVLDMSGKVLFGVVILLNIVLKGFCRNLNCRVLVDKGE